MLGEHGFGILHSREMSVIQKRAEQIVRDVEKESFKITGLVQDKKERALTRCYGFAEGNERRGWQQIKMENFPLRCLKWIVLCRFFLSLG